MESSSEDEDSVVQLRAALKRKTQELREMQDEFDEYTQSSHELEQELEQELSRVEKRNTHLLNKNQLFERDLQLVRSKLEEALEQAHAFEDELAATRSALETAVVARRKLEQDQDDLETQVRVLQATEADLRHKMEREIEEKVFLVSDQEELQREHELADERFRQEIMDLKSELYSLQQKYEDVTGSSDHRGSFSGNDSMATTRSQSEDDDDYERYDENSLRHSTVHERDEISREVLIESLRQEIDAQSSRVQDETDARAAAEAKVQQLLVSLAQMEAMESELTDMTDELIEKSQEIRSRDEQIEELRESLMKLQSEIATIHDGDIERTDEREDMRSELESKIADINQLKEEIDVVKSQCDDLAEIERQLTNRLEHELEAVDELKETIESLTTKLEESQQERSELEKRLQTDKGEISQNRKEVEELGNLNAELQQQLDEASKKATELERASALSTASTAPTVHEKDPKDPDTKRLMVEIQTMRTSLNSLSAENARLRNQEGMSSSVAPAKRVSADVLQVNFTPEQLARKYLAERTRNASLLSRLQTVCGNIQVFCRVRPIINEELEKSWGSKLAVNVVNQSDLAAMDIRPDRTFTNGKMANGNMEALANSGSWKVFTFDRILGPEETQNDVFREIEPVAQSVVDGFKACIFAYGQTGSGKTYTMEGTSSDPGLNYRIINHMFQSVQLRGSIFTPKVGNNEAEPDQDVDMDGLHAATDSSMYHVQVGVLEIYNDSLRDLINTKNPKALEIRHDSSTGDICVPDLTMATVSSPQQTIDVLREAQTNRVTGKTNVNMHSSRSHSIVIVQISKRRPEGDDETDSTDFVEEENCGKLYLVDLAGSERVKKSNVSGDMLREAAHINKSLSALADVMEALDKKMAHVPYRNSKLTYLLQDVLNSSCKTVMIVNVGPTIENASETFRSLQLAERVRNIVVGRNQIVKNKKDILSAKKAFAELQSLKQQMQISKRKYTQSQQSVVALKRDQKNQSEKQSTALQSRLKYWETQNESLKTQNESLKRLVDDISSQLKSERETRQKEAEQREAAQRQLRQQNAKSRVSSSQQEAQQKLLQDREEEIKKLRQLLTEARRRSTSSLIPRLPTSSPPMKKPKSVSSSKSSRTSAGNNQLENDEAASSESSGINPPAVSARLSKLRTVTRRSADAHLQSNNTTKESPRTTKRGSSLGSARSLPTASARTASKAKSGVWK